MIFSIPGKKYGHWTAQDHKIKISAASVCHQDDTNWVHLLTYYSYFCIVTTHKGSVDFVDKAFRC